ncbi:hypothetical protein NDU88_001837 [Pleurodeles waltl]|uniref:Uncharacterized protein n=1 Tax=Pleurodeles waltl TaxID=8319 RepID=A0AAV7LYT4_PLEWA|nr:hypothetical protein NDU88_001837 [Pleurodeles waltl]
MIGHKDEAVDCGGKQDAGMIQPVLEGPDHTAHWPNWTDHPLKGPRVHWETALRYWEPGGGDLSPMNPNGENI